MVAVGDSIPSVALTEGAPDKQVNLAEEIGSGSALIIGVPAAFSTYSASIVSNLCSMKRC